MPLRLAPRSSRPNVGVFCVALDRERTSPVASSLPSSHPVSNQVFCWPCSSRDSTARPFSCANITVFLFSELCSIFPCATASSTCRNTSLPRRFNILDRPNLSLPHGKATSADPPTPARSGLKPIATPSSAPPVTCFSACLILATRAADPQSPNHALNRGVLTCTHWR